jgi:anti-sigma factor RsiW
MSHHENPHLDDRIAALVDGELDHDARDRALVHITDCSSCRAEVEATRRLKARLGRLADPVASDELLGLLAAIGAAGAPRDVEPGAPGPTRPQSRSDARRPTAARTGSSRPGRRRVRRGGLVAISSGGLVSAALSVAFVLGGGTTGGRPVTPEVEQFTVEHAAVTNEVPLSNPAGSGVTASFARPAPP